MTHLDEQLPKCLKKLLKKIKHHQVIWTEIIWSSTFLMPTDRREFDYNLEHAQDVDLAIVSLDVLDVKRNTYGYLMLHHILILLYTPILTESFQMFISL